MCHSHPRNPNLDPRSTAVCLHQSAHQNSLDSQTLQKPTSRSCTCRKKPWESFAAAHKTHQETTMLSRAPVSASPLHHTGHTTAHHLLWYLYAQPLCTTITVKVLFIPLRVGCKWRPPLLALSKGAPKAQFAGNSKAVQSGQQPSDKAWRCKSVQHGSAGNLAQAQQQDNLHMPQAGVVERKTPHVHKTHTYWVQSAINGGVCVVREHVRHN